MTSLKLWDSISNSVLCLDSLSRASTLLSWVALWALEFAHASVRAQRALWSGSSLTMKTLEFLTGPYRAFVPMLNWTYDT
jgi:hypothetical protein